MDRLVTLLWRKTGDSAPNKLEGGGGVLATGVADNPWDIVGSVEGANFLVEQINGGLKTEFVEGRFSLSCERWRSWLGCDSIYM